MILSIVTPTMNRRDELALCIQSVMRVCDGLDFEHIIVDNLSSDGTEELIEDYRSKAQYPVVYVREPDQGLYFAMNKGIRYAKGEWIHILNSDDIYAHELKLKKLITDISINIDVLAFGIRLLNNDDSLIFEWTPKFRKRIHHYATPHPGLIIRKAFYKVHGLYNTKYKIISDAVFMCENFDKAQIQYSKDILVDMRTDGLSSRESWTNYKEQLVMMFKYHKYPWYYKGIQGAKLSRRALRFLVKKSFCKQR